MVSLRAAQWRNALAKVGLAVPFWAVHDLGMAAVLDPGSVPIGHRPGTAASRLSPEHGLLLTAWAETVQVPAWWSNS